MNKDAKVSRSLIRQTAMSEPGCENLEEEHDETAHETPDGGRAARRAGPPRGDSDGRDTTGVSRDGGTTHPHVRHVPRRRAAGYEGRVDAGGASARRNGHVPAHPVRRSPA